MDRLVRRYALAFCCVLLPIWLGLYAVNFAVSRLLPQQTTTVTLPYVFQPKSKAAQPPAAGKAAAAAQAEPAPDSGIHLLANHISGRFSYAVASAFLYLIAVATALFSGAILFWRLRRAQTIDRWLAGLAGALTFGLAGGVSYWQWVATPYALARPLVLENLLNAADRVPLLDQIAVKGRPTGDMMVALIQVNTLVGLIPVGLLLVVLFVLSLRPDDAQIRQNRPAALDDLKKRVTATRLALRLGSSILVVAVLASKAALDWPLKLVSPSQSEALKPIADSLTLVLGATGTIALLAAFGPAVAAWWLDVERYRVLAQAPAGAQANRPVDELVFAPLPAITGLMAVLAPLLASPFINGVQSLLGALGK